MTAKCCIIAWCAKSAKEIANDSNIKVMDVVKKKKINIYFPRYVSVERPNMALSDRQFIIK